MALQVLRWTAAVTLIAISATGCVALAVGAAGGAAGAVYAKGRLTDHIDATVERTHTAVVQTLEDNGLPLLKDEADVASAEVNSKYADGKDIWIDLEAQTSSVTKITIRVGVFGDKQRSLDLLEDIKRRL